MALVAKYSLPVRASKRASTTRSMWDERNAALLTSPWTSVTQSNPSTVDTDAGACLPTSEPTPLHTYAMLLCSTKK